MDYMKIRILPLTIFYILIGVLFVVLLFSHGPSFSIFL